MARGNLHPLSLIFSVLHSLLVFQGLTANSLVCFSLLHKLYGTNKTIHLLFYSLNLNDIY